jgi:hypothetical protein
VLIHVSHPEYPDEGMTGVVIVMNKSLAANLLTCVKKTLGKSVDDLGDLDVTDNLLPA